MRKMSFYTIRQKSFTHFHLEKWKNNNFSMFCTALSLDPEIPFR